MQALVLGGGIAGCVTACLLADLRIEVAIVEQRQDVMAGASRWNEGKLHLGYVYTGTPSLATASLMQQGTAVFEDVIEQVIGEPIPGTWYSRPVTYLVDRDSMVAPDILWERAQAVAARAAETALHVPGLLRHLGTDPLLERLDLDQAKAETGERGFAAAWRTTERAVSPRPLADAIRKAVAARKIPVVRGVVSCVEPTGPGWRTQLVDGRALAAPIVINCLWENRPAVDAGIRVTGEPVSIRYRRGLFGSGLSLLRERAPSTRILGRYGDVTPYANGDACLTWYPTGLLAHSDNGKPPDVPRADVRDADTESVMREHLLGLGLDPGLVESLDHWEVRGGFVVAYGHGDIDRMDSPLHERYRPDVEELRPGYISVDTGKFTLGPLMATRAVELARTRLKVRGASAS